MKMSVVILDTDPIVESMVLECIGSSNAEVEMVSETTAARTYIESLGAELIVVNADMPRGWRFCTELRKEPETCRIPLVIVSQKATEDVFNDHQKLPTRADAYLKKPLVADQFRVAILAVLKGHSLDADLEVDLGIESAESTEVNLVESPVVHAESVADPSPPETSATVSPPTIPAPAKTKAFKGTVVIDDSMVHAVEAIREKSLDVVDEPSIIEPEQTRVDASSLQSTLVQAQDFSHRDEPSQGLGHEGAIGTFDVREERDQLKTRVNELVQTGRALETAQQEQAQETERLRRQIEALQAECEVLEEARQRLAHELEVSQRGQNELRAELEDAWHRDTPGDSGDAAYIRALEGYIDQLHAGFDELAQNASSTDMELRATVARYQEREAALLEIRAGESRLTDTVLAVVEHVYEGLDLLRQDIHNGVPEPPALNPLPEPPEGVPAPVAKPQLPLRPSRRSSSLDSGVVPSEHTPPSSIPEAAASAVTSSQERRAPANISHPPVGDPDSDWQTRTVLREPPSSKVETSKEPQDFSLPAEDAFDDLGIDFDDLDQLESLLSNPSKTPPKEPSTTVAGAPLLDPGLLDDLGVDASSERERDLPYEA